MNIIDSIWFTMSDGMTIGIVVGEDEVTRKRKAYMGIGNGINQETDENRILIHGYPVTKGALQNIINRLDE